MMTLMVDLIIMVMFTSDSASDLEKTGTGGTSSGGDEGIFKNFYASLSIRGLYEQKSRIHASYSRHSRVCIDDKKIYMIAEDLEQRFRGSINMIVNNCIIDSISA